VILGKPSRVSHGCCSELNAKSWCPAALDRPDGFTGVEDPEWAEDDVAVLDPEGAPIGVSAMVEVEDPDIADDDTRSRRWLRVFLSSSGSLPCE